MEGLTRGAIVTVAGGGDYTGKPRPALVVQSDLFNPTHASVTVCPLTSERVDAPMFRIDVDPSAENGLKRPSQVMVDKVTSIRRDRALKIIGNLEQARLTEIERSLRLWMDL